LIDQEFLIRVKVNGKIIDPNIEYFEQYILKGNEVTKIKNFKTSDEFF
jgi:hypothetical protein